MRRSVAAFVMSVIILTSMATDISAQEKLNVNLSGRILLDGVSFLNNRPTMTGKSGIPDLRLAAKAIYGNWYGKLDIGFAGNKVSVKDAYLQYRKSQDIFRIGYMFGYWGMDASLSTCDLLFNTCSPTAEMLYPGRRIGFSYTRFDPHYYLSVGAFIGDRLNVNKDIRQGFNTTLRSVWRPVNEENRLVHAGFSAYYRIPDKKMDTAGGIIELSPSISYLSIPEFQHLTFNVSHHQLDLDAEFYSFFKRFMILSEYMCTFINRNLHQWYFGQGGYLTVGYLLKGSRLGYDQMDAVLLMPPDPKSLLFLIRYSLCDLNDSRGMIDGGIQKDLSVGLDYFFNKYISTRLNYSWISLDSHSKFGRNDIHLLQTRIQFRF